MAEELMKQALTPVQLARRKMLENREWLAANIMEICKDYADKWILIWDKKIVHVGHSYEEVIKVAEEKYPLDELEILKVPDKAESIATPL